MKIIQSQDRCEKCRRNYPSFKARFLENLSLSTQRFVWNFGRKLVTKKKREKEYRVFKYRIPQRLYDFLLLKCIRYEMYFLHNFCHGFCKLQ